MHLITILKTFVRVLQVSFGRYLSCGFSRHYSLLYRSVTVDRMFFFIKTLLFGGKKMALFPLDKGRFTSFDRKIRTDLPVWTFRAE